MFVVRFRVGVPVKDDPGKGHPFLCFCFIFRLGVLSPNCFATPLPSASPLAGELPTSSLIRLAATGADSDVAAPAQSLDEPLWVPPLGVRFNIFLKSLDKMLEIVFNEREVSNG